MKFSLKAAAPALGLVLALGSPAAAEQIIADDLTVQGGICVGNGCDFGNFEPTGVRIKSVAPILVFNDTDLNGDFNWGFAANSFSVESDVFTIRDYTDGGGNSFTGPVVIESGARGNMIRLSEEGHFGIKTFAPERDLHIVDGSAPGIRLEQSTDEAQPLHKWDLVAGNSGFLLVDPPDMGGLSFVPFAIANGAPSRAFQIASDGNIGMGIATPQVPLHVESDSGGAPVDMMRLENNGGVVFRLKDTSAGGQEFTFQSNGGIFRIASPAVPGPEFTMDDFGNVTITGEIITAGSCSAGCDRVFDEGYDLPDMTEHHAAMWELGHLPNVGPTAEDGPMNLSEKVGGMLNELEHAHIFISQLNADISALHARGAESDAEMQQFLAQLAELQSTISE